MDKNIPYEGNTSWVEQTILDAITCLQQEEMPECGVDCDFCNYRKEAKKYED